VATLAPVEEIEVDVHWRSVAPEPDGERAFHLVRVEGFPPFLAGCARGLLAGVGRDPDLGLDAGHGDARRAHLGGRHDAQLRDPVGVGLVLRTLVDGLGLGHDAVRPNLSDLGHLRADDDQIVELEVLVVLQDDPELGGRRVLRAEDAADAVLAHDALRSATASRSAR
jgi:hypothetical protein